MYVIGLTGGIASGKSHAASFFAKNGACMLNCDSLGHQTYVKGTLAYSKIVSAFGSDILDDNDEIARRALGAIVFSNSIKMEQLTSITWPAIKELIKINLNDFKDKNSEAIVILEAAVLIEAGWQDLADQILVIHTPRELAVNRVINRDNLNAKQAEERIDSQLSNEKRIKYADIIIENSGDLHDFESKLTSFWEQI